MNIFSTTIKFNQKMVGMFGLVVTCLTTNAQQVRPIDQMKAIGDKIIANTPFKYNLDFYQKQGDMQTIDFGKTFGLGKLQSAYAYSEISSPKDTALKFTFTHSDGVKIWLNGAVVYESATPQKVKLTYLERSIELEKSLVLNLKSGRNKLLIKSTTTGAEWKFLITPGDLSIAKIGLEKMSEVSKDIAKLSAWLVIGPIPANSIQEGLSLKFAVEDGFETGKIYNVAGENIAWSVPKIELTPTLIDPKPFWGTYYNFNYHTGALVWGLYRLSEETGDPKYKAFTKRHCDFMMQTKPYIAYHLQNLYQFNVTNFFIVNTPLLDFTAAPALPFAYMLMQEPNFDTRASYEVFFKNIKDYVINKQVRLNGKNFTRLTPEKYTTWVDDMFMGIPFVTLCARESKDPVEKAKLWNEAANQVIEFNKVLWNNKTNLYPHAVHSERKVDYPHWLRANGWGIWAATEVLAGLDKKHPKYKQVLDIYTKHVNSLITFQDKETGFWRNVINQPTASFETSGTSIITMAIARGINNGWLDKAKYTPYALNGWKAVSSRIDKDGTVHGIIVGSMTSEDYMYYERQAKVDDDSHGTLCVMFCGIEVDKLMQNNKK